MCKDIAVVSDQLQTIKLGSMTMTIPNNEIAAALAKAQGAITNAKKTSNNPFFNRKYAALDEVWDVCRKPLSDNGLAFSQWPYAVSTGETFKWWDKDGKMKEAPGAIITITSLLEHSSGQFKCSEYSLPAVWDAQKEGSAITYARRYAMMSILGIAPEDDDGNEASSQNDPSNQKPAQQQQQRTRQQQTQKPADTNQKPAAQQTAQTQTTQRPTQTQTQTQTQTTAQNQASTTQNQGVQVPCKQCGKDIIGKTFKHNDGNIVSLMDHTVKAYGAPLCEECFVAWLNNTQPKYSTQATEQAPAQTAQTNQNQATTSDQNEAWQGIPCQKCGTKIYGNLKNGKPKALYSKQKLGGCFCDPCGVEESKRQEEEAKAKLLPQQQAPQTQQAA